MVNYRSISSEDFIKLIENGKYLLTDYKFIIIGSIM